MQQTWELFRAIEKAYMDLNGSDNINAVTNALLDTFEWVSEHIVAAQPVTPVELSERFPFGD